MPRGEGNAKAEGGATKGRRRASPCAPRVQKAASAMLSLRAAEHEGRVGAAAPTSQDEPWQVILDHDQESGPKA